MSNSESMIIPKQRVYYVIFCEVKYSSFAEAKEKAPDMIASHIARSKELQSNGTLLLSGAFIDKTDEPLTTMGVLSSREAAEEYIQGDPFVVAGMVDKWYIREWANMFG